MFCVFLCHLETLNRIVYESSPSTSVRATLQNPFARLCSSVMTVTEFTKKSVENETSD